MAQSKSQGSGIKFVALGSKQKISKIALLLSVSGKAELWEKGQTRKISAIPLEFDSDKLLLTLRVTSSDFTKKKSVLLHFSAHNVNFFSKVQVEKVSENQLVVSVSGDFYRLENRKKFRLMMYPAIIAHAEFAEDFKVLAKEDNVLQFSKKKDHFPWDVAKEFATLTKNEKQKFRIEDISEEGLSIDVSKGLSEEFSKGKKFKQVLIYFGSDKILIQEVIVAYQVISSQERLKVGFNITKASVNDSALLKDKIDAALSRLDFGHDFEEFVKK